MPSPGAMFGGVSFMEKVFSCIGRTIGGNLYAETVAWMPGFAFLVGSATSLLGLSLFV